MFYHTNATVNSLGLFATTNTNGSTAMTPASALFNHNCRVNALQYDQHELGLPFSQLPNSASGLQFMSISMPQSVMAPPPPMLTSTEFRDLIAFDRLLEDYIYLYPEVPLPPLARLCTREIVANVVMAHPEVPINDSTALHSVLIADARRRLLPTDIESIIKGFVFFPLDSSTNTLATFNTHLSRCVETYALLEIHKERWNKIFTSTLKGRFGDMVHCAYRIGMTQTPTAISAIPTINSPAATTCMPANSGPAQLAQPTSAEPPVLRLLCHFSVIVYLDLWHFRLSLCFGFPLSFFLILLG